MGRGDIGWCIAHHVHASFRAVQGSRLTDAVGDDVVALLALTGECAEGEIPPQTALLHLRPANGLEIAGGDPQQLALGLKVIQPAENAGAYLYSQIFRIACDFSAHECRYVRHSGLPLRLRHIRRFQVRSQNADIGVAMDRNSIEPEIETKEMFYGVMEGVVVDGITAIEQRAVDVEEISVGCAPIKSGT